MTIFEMVPFEDHSILTVKDNDGRIFVAMKPIVEALGLSWASQLVRIKDHPIISEGMSITDIPSGGGMQEMVLLELEKFHGWLATITTKRIPDPTKKAIIEAYQRRAFRVLFEHFHGKPTRIGVSQVDIDRKRAMAIKTSGQIIDMTDPAQRRFTYAILMQLCQEAGIVPPPLDQLGADAPDEHPDVVAFWAGVAVLLANGIKFDHSRDSSVLAINMPDIAKRFAAMGCDVKVTGRLKTALKTSKRPKFITTKNVNSALLKKAVPCWLFDRLPVPVAGQMPVVH